MKVTVIAVGKPGGLLQGAIAEYETRAARYWSMETVQVREARASQGVSGEQVRNTEAERLLARVPSGAQLVALTRVGGDAISSIRFARELGDLARRGAAGVAFLIGGAYGLGDEVLRAADRRMRLSSLTLPHDLARLMLVEQLYRAGTILRGEPYHKGVE